MSKQPHKSEQKPLVNRHDRRAARHKVPKGKRGLEGVDLDRVVLDDKVVYRDDSYKDRNKIFNKSAVDAVRRRIAEAGKIFRLPQSIKTKRRPFRSSCLLLNKDGRQHEFLPDNPGRHCLLVHRSVAKILTSGVCMLVRVTDTQDCQGTDLDGSWAIVPAEYRMMNTTTIQHLRRRPFFFLRRYWYEISFDGRVQPAHLLFDYGLNPVAKRQKLWITREYVPIRDTGKDNDYLRFWLYKPSKK